MRETAAAPADACEDAEPQPAHAGAPVPRVAVPPPPTAASAVPVPVRDPYWETFSSAFGDEHRRVYGPTSNPGCVSSSALRAQADGLLVGIVSECDAWAQQRGVVVPRDAIAQALSRRMASTWLSWSGRDDRLRDRGHPIGWICGDLQRLAYGRSGELGAVEIWKRTQGPIAKPVRTEKDVVPVSPDDAARVRAEARALSALLSRGMGFEHAIALIRSESDRLRAPPTGAGPPIP